MRTYPLFFILTKSFNMIRAGSTEATVSSTTEMASDISVSDPINPKELIDYEIVDKEITDEKEAFDIILKLSGYEWSVEEYLKEKGYKNYKAEDWTSILLDRNYYKVNNVISDYLVQNYEWKWAYIKVKGHTVYWQVRVRQHKSMLNTPYGKIEVPLLSVNDIPMMFPIKYLLTPEERETYELYNDRPRSYDQMELEKKIISDLILYSQQWPKKDMEDVKELFEKIKRECETIWTITKISFRNQIFRLEFWWRYLTDTDGRIEPQVAPPFSLDINFRDKTITCSGRHPHNLHPDPCLGWVLTDLRDKCFASKDIYGLVMGMVEFGNSWTSSDAANWDRDTSALLREEIRRGNYNWTSLKAVWIPLIDIYKTAMRTGSYDFFLGYENLRDWFINEFDNEEFVNQIKDALYEKYGTNDNFNSLLRAMYIDYKHDNGLYEQMKTKYLPE